MWMEVIKTMGLSLSILMAADSFLLSTASIKMFPVAKVLKLTIFDTMTQIHSTKDLQSFDYAKDGGYVLFLPEARLYVGS